MDCKKCRVRPYNQELIKQQQQFDAPEPDRLQVMATHRLALGYIEFCLLHAAAPELLETLKIIRTALGIRIDFAPLGIALQLAPIIEQAIAKAEGK